MDLHVLSPAFDKQCAAYAKEISSGPLSDHRDPDYSSDYSNLWEDSDVPSAESSCYDVPKLEAHLYYFGIRGPRRRGPKLIFRTSKDVFTVPWSPEVEHRYMKILQVYEHDKLGKGNRWATVRSKVREPLLTRG